MRIDGGTWYDLELVDEQDPCFFYYEDKDDPVTYAVTFCSGDEGTPTRLQTWRPNILSCFAAGSNCAQSGSCTDEGYTLEFRQT